MRERDGFRCVDCGMTNDEHLARYGFSLEVHRIRPGSAYTLDGCATYCRDCHAVQPKRAQGVVSFAFHCDEEFGRLVRQGAERDRLDQYDINSGREKVSISRWVRWLVTERLHQLGLIPPKPYRGRPGRPPLLPPPRTPRHKRRQ